MIINKKFVNDCWCQISSFDIIRCDTDLSVGCGRRRGWRGRDAGQRVDARHAARRAAHAAHPAHASHAAHSAHGAHAAGAYARRRVRHCRCWCATDTLDTAFELIMNILSTFSCSLTIYKFIDRLSCFLQKKKLTIHIVGSCPIGLLEGQTYRTVILITVFPVIDNLSR